MKINETSKWRLCDLTTNLLNESVKDLSQTKIKDLQLDEIAYLVRQQMWIAPLIRICIQKINDNWDEINKYYPNSNLTEWFENIIKELILLPRINWDIDKTSFHKLSHIIKTNSCRAIKLDESIVVDFLNYTPKELVWNDETYTFFQKHINSHHGEVLKAIKLIQDFIICLNNGGNIRYNRNNKNRVIENLTEFEHLVLDELSEDKDELMDWMKNEQKIDYV